VRACLAVFDIFAVAGKDLRYLPYEDRRHRLAERLRRVDEPLALMPPPTAPAHAAVWLRRHQAAGVEGVVAKAARARLPAGRR
jgi:ATP-dependent DNA ligase